MRRRTVPSGNGPLAIRVRSAGWYALTQRGPRADARSQRAGCGITSAYSRRRPRLGCQRENSNLLATARSTATRDYECSTGAAARSSRLRLTRSRSPHDPAKEWSAALLKRLHEAPQLRRHADKSAALDGLSLTSRISAAIDVARAEGASFRAEQAGARDRSARN